MDPITHGLIGASTALSLAPKEKMYHAALTGTAGAMLPDLDVLIDSASDPLLQLEFHRQFSHSLLFIPIGAFIAAPLCWWITRKRLNFKETYIFSLIGSATAGLADTFTSYGVQLLWPFTDTRFAWNLISVFDPLFTLGIIIMLGLALFKRRSLYSRLALGWAALYLLFGWIQKGKAQKIAYELAEQRNQKVQQLIVKPTIANELLWSIRYVSNDSLYADGVRLIPFVDAKIYEGTATKILDWQKTYAEFRSSTLYNDIARFDKLSDGILIKHPDSNEVIGDGRYAMLPTSVDPLWGIKTDTLKPNQHIEFRTYREATPMIRTQFKEMLLGY